MTWFTVAVFPDKPDAPDSAYQAVFHNDAYPNTLQTRVEADTEHDALIALGNNLAD